MKKSILFYFIFSLLLMSSILYPQNIIEEQDSFEVQFNSDFWNNYSGIEGFCYGGGYFWLITWWGYIVQIDTTGNVLGINQAKTSTTWDSWHGAICFDSDTLWAVRGSQIYPLDYSGNIIGEVISILTLGSPYNGDIGGIIKDGNNFWLCEEWTPMIFKIDRSGNLIKNFPNSWCYNLYSPVITKLENKIIKIGYGRSPYNTWFNVLSLDMETGKIIDEWGYDYDQPLGLSLGEDCFWSIQDDQWNSKVIVRKYTIPEFSPSPSLPSTAWGDFSITDWNYFPFQSSAIEGTFGFGYDKINKVYWLGDGIGHLHAFYDNNILPCTSLNTWYGAGFFWDISAENDSLIFLGTSWPGFPEGVYYAYLRNDTLTALDDWDIAMRQTDGIAANGSYIWCSGRDTVHTTRDLSNHIGKYDLEGNLEAHWVYPDSNNYNFEDLTWHDNSLWAISRSEPFGFDVYIYNINHNTGEIIQRYDTGWHQPSANVSALLASDGDHLITIGTTSTGTFDGYENTHLRILKIIPKSTNVIQNDHSTPSHFKLHQNYPNPFNSSTYIQYDLAKQANVELIIYNCYGQEVKTLCSKIENPGSYKVIWDGENKYGGIVSTGIYFCKLKTDFFAKTIKIILLR